MTEANSQARIEQIGRELVMISAAFDSASDAIKIADLTGRSIYHNKAFFKLFEYTVEELTAAGGPSALFVDAGVRQEVFKNLQSGLPYSGEVVMRTRGGRLIPVILHADQIKDSQGNSLGILILCTDITERKWAEESLLKEKRFSDATTASLPGIFYLIDEQGKFLRWNQNLELVSGYSAAEIALMNPLDFFVGGDQQLIAERIQAVFAEGRATAEANFVSKNGLQTPYYFTGQRVVLDQTPCLVGMGVDLSERKQAEEELRASEDRYRDLVENSGLLIGTHDLDGNILSVNRSVIEQVGFARAEDFVGLTISDFLIPEVRHLYLAYIDRLRTEGRARGTMKVMLPKGEARVLEYDNSLRREGVDAPIVRCIGRDVTEQVRAKENLKKATQFRDNVMECVTNAIAVLNREGIFTLVNRRACEIAGFEADELLDRHFSIFLPPENLTAAQELIEKVLTLGIPVSGCETELIRKNGDKRLIRFSLMAMTEDGAITGLVGTAEDITELKQLQQQIIQSERLAWLGQMIAGTAHELRDPLNRIINYALKLQEDERDPVASRKLDVIVRAGEQAAQIVSDLVVFARRQELENGKEIDLNGLIEDALRQRARELAANNITVIRESNPIPRVYGEERLLQRVFLNIILNAEQAIGSQQGGTLKISTGIKQTDSEKVVVKITDTGPGIKLEHLARLFDPFFTTKPIGQGMGLGLAFSYGVIKMHGGEIRVEDSPDSGACFVVELPTL
jgi:PAS domain S-box-containing protein